MPFIEASFDTMLRQASMTAAEYMEKAVKEIDKQFGDGYAAKHPELVSKFMEVAASDMNASILIKGHYEAMELLTDRLGKELRNLTNKIVAAKPTDS